MEHLHIEKAVLLTNISSYVMKGTGILASFLVLHVLSPAEFGLWKVAMAIAGVASSWFMAIHPAVTAEMIRAEVDHGVERHGLILWKGYWRLTLVLTLLASVLAVFMGAMISRWFGLTDVRLFYLAMGLMFLWVVKVHAQIWSKVLYQFRPMLWSQIIEGVSYLGLLWVFLYGMRAGALGLGIANLVSVMLGLCCSGWLILKGWRHCPATSIQQDLVQLTNLLRQHGKWAFVLKLLKDNIDAFRIWFIQWMIGPYAVGLYSFAQSILVQFLTILNIETAFVATITRVVDVRDRFLALMGQAVRLSTVVYTAIFVTACIAVPLAVPLLFPAYVPGITVFLTIAPYIILNGMYAILSNVFHILRWQKKLCLIYLGRVVLFAIMIVTIGWKRPLVVASLEFVVGASLQVVLMMLILRRAYALEGAMGPLFLPARTDLPLLRERTARAWSVMQHFFRRPR